jgi:1-acyl-sn-glycerol-3-phosphate acyltransferase
MTDPAPPRTEPPPGHVPTLPPSLPRVRGNRLARGFGKGMLRLGGWRMEGQFPDLPQAVLIGAPHSSNWDGVWGFAAKLALGFDIRILGKRELFWGPLGPLLRRLGVIAVDRRASAGTVEQTVAMFRTHPRFWLGIAPEGTRKPVARWKAGFWKIARDAGVPVVPVYFHYPRRVIGIGPAWLPGTDFDADLARTLAWYRQVSRGKYRDVGG